MQDINAILEVDCAIPDRALLAEIAAELSKIAGIVGDTANERALNKAAFYLAAGVEVLLSAGDFLIPSGSRAGLVHRISGAGCNCEAGRHGRSCWHAAVAEIVAVAWERLAEAQDNGEDGEVTWGSELEPSAYDVITVERRQVVEPPAEPPIDNGPADNWGGFYAPLGPRIAAARRALFAAI